MSDYVPPDLLIEVLKRLPVKSLVRFTCVCKSWYSLITSPSFISKHLYQTIESHKKKRDFTLLLRHYDTDEVWGQGFLQKEHYTLHFDDETLGQECRELEFPLSTQLGYFRIVGSCNGLICLSDDLFGYTGRIILWNPLISQSVSTPITISSLKWPNIFVLGFGVDPLTYEHKVVRITYYQESLQFYKYPPLVEIYTLTAGLWRIVTPVVIPPYCMVEFMWTQAFLNGSVHWIAYDQHVVGGGFRCLIVSFDMGDEVFGEILLPAALTGQLAVNLSVAVLEGSLAVVEHDKRIESPTCCMWVMKEYGIVESWKKLVMVDLLEEPERVLGCRKNGDVLLSMRQNFLALYEPRMRLIKNVGIRGSSHSFYVDTYMETLVLLNRTK